MPDNKYPVAQGMDQPPSELIEYMGKRKPAGRAQRPARNPKVPGADNVGERFGRGLDYWLNVIDKNPPPPKYADASSAAEAERRWTLENADAQRNVQMEDLIARQPQPAEDPHADQMRSETEQMRMGIDADADALARAAATPNARTDGGQRVYANTETRPDGSKVLTPKATGEEVDLYKGKQR